MIWTVVADFQVPDPARIFTSTSGQRMQNFSNSGRKYRKQTRLIHMCAAELQTAKKDADLGELSRRHLGPRASRGPIDNRAQ